MKFRSYSAFKKRMLKDKTVKEAYDKLAPEFELISLLIQKRIDEGVTQKELAKRMGTQQSAIARFESGNSNPSLAWVQDMAHALHAKIKISIR